MSAVQAIETLIHEARVHRIQGDRDTAIQCYMTVIPTISSFLERCKPEEKAYLEATLSNARMELEMVRSLGEKPKTEEVIQPVYERVPSIAASSIDDAASTDSASTIASVPDAKNKAASPKRSFKETCRVFFKRSHATLKLSHATPTSSEPTPSEKTATPCKSFCVFSKVGAFFIAIWNGIVIFTRCTSIIFTQFFCMWKGVFTRTKPSKWSVSYKHAKRTIQLQ